MAVVATDRPPRSLSPDLIMLVVVMIAIGRFHSKENIHRRSWLGNAGLYVVMAAGLAAYGLNSGFGEGLSMIEFWHTFPSSRVFILPAL